MGLFGVCCGTCLGANMFCVKIGEFLKILQKLLEKVVRTKIDEFMTYILFLKCQSNRVFHGLWEDCFIGTKA